MNEKVQRGLEHFLDEMLARHEAENLAVCVGVGNRVIAEAYRSSILVLDEHTKFDMASVTKILAPTMLALMAVEKGLLKVEDRVSRFYDCPADKEPMTIGHLLTHTMGIGHKSLDVAGNTCDNIAGYILGIPSDIPIGSNVRYSCPGFILLGKILEEIYGKRLDALFSEMISAPLDMTETGYLPASGPFVNSNNTDAEEGLVNDYNCRFLGGVAGNAGIYSTMRDMKKFAGMLINCGEGLIARETFELATRNHTPDMDEARGLGFKVVDERYRQTGGLFPVGTIGHCGHTGQSIFVDVESGLYAIILSDMTLCSEIRRGEGYGPVMDNRGKIHGCLRELLRANEIIA